MFFGNLLFNFIKDKNVASVFPTTRKTVLKICDFINFDKDIVIVEYGPGDGVFTKYILSKINTNSKLIVIEKNKDLFFFLKNNFKDNRLKIFNDDAQNIKKILKKEKIERVNYVISGIPLSFLNNFEKENIIKDTYEILKIGGIFLVYQFSKKSEKTIKKYFIDIVFFSQIFNIPPLFIFKSEKK